MSNIDDTYYNLAEIQANYYDKVATDSLFPNIDLSNYCSKTEVDDIDNGLPTLILNIYTKTEIDTQLTDYTSITYLPNNYMTSLLITQALTNNYASISLLGCNFYDKTYLGNHFSLKANVSELTGLVTTGYLELNYTNSVGLTAEYYKKTDIDNMLLSYSTGSHDDYNLANKVSTIGDATISGNLNVDGRILVDGSHLNVQPKSSTSSETLVFDQSFSTAFGSDSDGINAYGRQGGNSHLKIHNGRSGSVCNVFIVGNLDAGITQAQTSIKAYVNHAGYQGNIQIEPRWRSQGFIHSNTNYPEGLLSFAVKDDLYMYVGIEVVYFYKPTTNASDDRLT